MIYASYWWVFKNASFSLSMIYSEVWGCYRKGRASLFLFYSWGNRRKLKLQLKNCNMSTPGEVSGEFVEKNPALASPALSPEQWILLELNNCWVVHSQLHTKKPTVPDLIQLYSCFNLFSLHMNVGEGNWYRGVVIFMEEQESEKVYSSSVYYS